MPREIAM